MEKSKAAAAIKKRFGNSTIAQQAALAATKALASAASSGDKDQCTKPRVDLLYKNAASEGPQHSGGSKTTQSTAHQAAPGALAAIAQPSMQPYLTQRPETELNDNRDYCMPKEDSLDEQLFKGHLDSSATPHGHSEAPCTETVHGGDSRFGSRSPVNVHAAHSGSQLDRSYDQIRAPKQRSPSMSQRREEVLRLREKGASHALPAHRPNSPLPEDRQAMQMLVQSMASTSNQSNMQEQEGTVSAASAGHAAQPTDSATVGSSEPSVGVCNTDECAQTAATCEVQQVPTPSKPQVSSDHQEIGCTDRQAASVPIANSPDTCPLSPLGKVIKSTPSELRYSAPPDMSKVQARYLEPADAASKSREGSPNRHAAHQRHYWWRLGQMHADVPDYKSSQARMYENDHCLGTGHEQAIVTLKQVEWSFDGAHPALAGEHCLRTREQNDALKKERLNAQKRLDEARRIADDMHRRSPARRGQLKAAAAVRASADHALLDRQQARGSGSDRLNGRPRPNSADPTIRSIPPATVAGSTSGELAGQEEALRRLQEQSDAVARRAVTVLSRSEQLGQTVDAPLVERESVEYLRPQTASARDPNPAACFVSSSDERQVPMIPPPSSASGAVNEIESIRNEAVPGPDHQDESSDPVVRPCGQELVTAPVHPQAYPDEEVATGAYTESRYAAYSQDLNLDMQLRFTAGVQAEDVEGGYESDLERDTVQQHHVAAEHAVDMLLQSLEQKVTDESAIEAFKNDNAWMDGYRKDVVSRCRSEGMPQVGYFDEVVDAGFQSPEPIIAGCTESLSPGERALLQQRLIPEDVGLVANEAIAQAERVTAALARARAREGYFSDDAMNGQRRFRPTRSKTFGFEKRAQMRPKPISQVKMEQELEMKRRREEKETAKKFKAKEVPHTSSKKADGLFYKKQLEQSIAAKKRIESRKQELSEMMSDGSAFSFYVKDMERREEKARRLEAHRNNKNRFQVPFKAKEVPSHVRENRVEHMLEKQQQRKEEARAQAHKKLSEVNKEFERKQGRVAKAMTAATQPFIGTVEDNIMYAKAPNSKSVHPLVVVAAKAVGLHDAIMQLPKKYKTLLQEPGHNLGYHELNNAEMHLLGLARKNFEVRAKHSALRHTDTLWNKFSGKKPAGAVPDFDLLHAQWETRLSSARDRLRQRSLTQPKDFSFISGDPKEMAAKQAREAERQQKVVLDQMLDEEELTELRWPFRSSRGKVNPTEPPVFMPVEYHETKASQLRRKYVQNRKEHGQYELRSVKEERARVAAKLELQRRAKAHVAKEQASARRKIMQDLQKENNGSNLDKKQEDTESIEGGEDSRNATEFKEKTTEDEEMIDRLAEAHRQSRHNKIEADVSNMTRELLATAGLDVLRFVEGPQHPTQSAKQVLEAIVASVPRNRAEVGKQLSDHDDQVLKQCLREIGQEWDTTGGNARENAIDRLKTHIWNFMR